MTTVAWGKVDPFTLLHDQRGATALEFAFVAPFLFTLLIGILNIALIFLAQEGLETACEQASRLIMTGQAQHSNLTQAQFQNAACGYLPAYLLCANLYVDVTTTTSYAAANTAAPTFTYNSSGAVNNSFNYTIGGTNSIVVVRLMYLWPVTNGLFGLIFSNQSGNNRMLLATSILTTENYGS